ncbi:MAG: DUF6640 family protein [Pseudomonadota bacterium]
MQTERSPRMRFIWKAVISLATIFYGLVPAIADLNETHLFHPGWSAHARVHGAWFLGFGAGMAGLSLFLTWRRDDARLAAVIGLLFAAAFWLAYLTSGLYGGSLVDEGGVEAQILGLDANLAVFSVLLVVFLAAAIGVGRGGADCGSGA